MSSRKLLVVAAFAALGLCFAQGASAGFPYKAPDPGTPPSTSPNSSGKLNNFGSDWVFAFSSISPANVSVEWVPPSTAIIRGTAVGGEVSGGSFVSGRQAVWDVNITVTGVVRTLGALSGGPAPFTQTVTYTGILTDDAAVAGTYTLKPAETIAKFVSLPTQLVGEPAPSAPWVINVGAEDGVTTNLIVTSPGFTFPAGNVLGVPVLDNQVFSFTETRTYTESPALLPAAVPATDGGESVYEAVNRVLGLTAPNAFLSNAGLEPLLVEPDFIWQLKDGGKIALISKSAGNTNTLGVYTDLGTGAVLTPVDTSTGFFIYPQPFPGKEIPLAAGQQFGWYLDSVGGSSNTFFSEPSLNTPGSIGDRRLRTYNLTTVNPISVQVQLPGGGAPVSVTPRFLLAWEDLVAGDNDFNDAMYIVADVAPVGSDADGPPVLRYCHSKSLDPAGLPNCLVDDLNTTGAVASLAINSSCRDDEPGTGSISIEYPSNTAIITWQNLSCSSDNSGTEEIKPPHQATEVVGTKIVITTENGVLWVDPGKSGYSVNGTDPKDKGGKNQTIEGNEALKVALVDSSKDKFLSFTTRFYVGKKKPQTVIVTALDADGNEVGTITRLLPGGADGVTEPQAFTSAEFGGNFAAVKFSATGTNAYGVFGGMFFTTLVP